MNRRPLSGSGNLEYLLPLHAFSEVVWMVVLQCGAVVKTMVVLAVRTFVCQRLRLPVVGLVGARSSTASPKPVNADICPVDLPVLVARPSPVDGGLWRGFGIGFGLGLFGLFGFGLWFVGVSLGCLGQAFRSWIAEPLGDEFLIREVPRVVAERVPEEPEVVVVEHHVGGGVLGPGLHDVCDVLGVLAGRLVREAA